MKWKMLRVISGFRRSDLSEPPDLGRSSLLLRSLDSEKHSPYNATCSTKKKRKTKTQKIENKKKRVNDVQFLNTDLSWYSKWWWRG